MRDSNLQQAAPVEPARSNVSVIDLTDPTRPRLRGSGDFTDTRGPNGLELAGRIVFAAGGQTVQAIDVTNPACLPGYKNACGLASLLFVKLSESSNISATLGWTC